MDRPRLLECCKSSTRRQITFNCEALGNFWYKQLGMKSLVN